MIKAHIGQFNGALTTSAAPARNVRQQVTSSLSEVETDLQSDVVDRVVGSSPSSLSEESSPETDFIPEPRAETSKYGRKRTRVETETIMLVGRR